MGAVRDAASYRSFRCSFQGVTRVLPHCDLAARAGRFASMIRKLFWTLATLTAVFAVTGLLDLRRAEKRRQLWAEATDAQ